MTLLAAGISMRTAPKIIITAILGCILVGVVIALILRTATAHADESRPVAERGDIRRAVRLIALSFFGIAAFVTGDAASTLLGLREEPQRSPLGLAITALSLVVMPTLAWAKRGMAARLNSVALKADAAETQLCTYLSAVVLLGLAANALAGWWWMDPIAGLVVAALAVREGRAAWTSGELCDC